MKRLIITFTLLTTFLFAFAASAGETQLFQKYESVRQALLKGSIDDVQRSAKELESAARDENQSAIADRASALSGAADIKGARDSFAMLSDQVIRFRDSRQGERPVVVYCPMHKTSWLQPKGPVTNPYAEAAMRSCGQIRNEPAAEAAPQHHHH